MRITSSNAALKTKSPSDITETPQTDNELAITSRQDVSNLHPVRSRKDPKSGHRQNTIKSIPAPKFSLDMSAVPPPLSNETLPPDNKPMPSQNSTPIGLQLNYLKSPPTRVNATTYELVPLSPDEMAQWLARQEKARTLKAEWEAEERRAFKQAALKAKMIEELELDDDSDVISWM